MLDKRKRNQRKQFIGNKNTEFKRVKSLENSDSDVFDENDYIKNKKQNSPINDPFSSVSFDSKSQFYEDESLNSSQMNSESRLSYPYFGGSIQTYQEPLKMFGFKNQDQSSRTLNMNKEDNWRKDRPRKINLRIKSKLNKLKNVFQLLRQDVQSISGILSHGKKTFGNVFQLSELVQQTFKNFENEQMKQKMRLQIILAEKQKTIQDLASSNRILSESLKHIEKNISYQNTFMQEKKKKQQNQLQNRINQLYQANYQNLNLKRQNEDLKEINEKLNEKIFDLEQKLESFDLQIEKKFQHLVGEYHQSFLDKAIDVRAKISLLYNELNNDLKKKEENRKNTLSRVTTVPNLRETFEKKRSDKNLRKMTKKEPKKSLHEIKSSNEESNLDIESRIEENSKRIQKQKSLMHLFASQHDERNLSKVKESQFGKSLRNLREEGFFTLENSIQMNYSMNNVDKKLDKIKKRFLEDVHIMKKRKQLQ